MTKIECPECGKDTAFTLFPTTDKRFWRCDECGFIIWKSSKPQVSKKKSDNSSSKKDCLTTSCFYNDHKGKCIHYNIMMECKAYRSPS